MPEPGQLSYLDLLAPPSPQVVTVSSAVVKTKTDFLTTTIRLLQGNSAFHTTLVEPVVRTVTEWGEVTSTLPPLSHPLLATKMLNSVFRLLHYIDIHFCFIKAMKNQQGLIYDITIRARTITF